MKADDIHLLDADTDSAAYQPNPQDRHPDHDCLHPAAPGIYLSSHRQDPVQEGGSEQPDTA